MRQIKTTAVAKKRNLLAKLIFVFLLFFISNLPGGILVKYTSATPLHFMLPVAGYSGFPETFESGTKTAYTYGTVSLGTGTWGLDDALIGNTLNDKKVGSKSVRLQNSGKLTMLFSLTSGVSTVSIQHAVFATDSPSIWGLWYSTNDGSSWTQAGGNITSNSAVLVQTTFNCSIYGSVRFEIRKISGGKLNIDDIQIVDNSGVACSTCTGISDTTPTQDNNMAMGNPSEATTALTDSNNFLIVKHQYALSYNNSKGMANWVSWHLSLAWKGSAERCNCFTQDLAIPNGYFRAVSSNYTGTGFDRGHLCPSDDRDLNDSDNAATFKMSNISPQAPNMNQDTWGNLEDYCRTLITEGKELYIIAGGYGTGGNGSAGGTTNTIGSGRINVPAHFWKVIVVLPVGTNDITRVTTGTRVIAVDMPNTQTVTSHPWGYYRTTTDAIETATGYDILSNVPISIQSAIESSVDTGPTL